jgi:hypothetical protein
MFMKAVSLLPLPLVTLALLTPGRVAGLSCVVGGLCEGKALSTTLDGTGDSCGTLAIDCAAALGRDADPSTPSEHAEMCTYMQCTTTLHSFGPVTADNRADVQAMTTPPVVTWWVGLAPFVRVRPCTCVCGRVWACVGMCASCVRPCVSCVCASLGDFQLT